MIDILVYCFLPFFVINSCIAAMAKFDAVKDGIACSKIDRAARTGEAEPLRDLWHLMERFKEMSLIILGVFIGLLVGVFWIKGFFVSPVLLFYVWIPITCFNIYYSHYFIWKRTFSNRVKFLEKEDSWQMPKLPRWLSEFLGFHH